MRECVLIKIGGGVITNKAQLCSPNYDQIDLMAKALQQVHQKGIDIILIHGAGSYGVIFNYVFVILFIFKIKLNIRSLKSKNMENSSWKNF